MAQNEIKELLRNFFDNNDDDFFYINEIQEKIQKTEEEIQQYLEELISDSFIRCIKYENGDETQLVYGKNYPVETYTVNSLRIKLQEPDYYLYVFGWDLKKSLKIFKISRAKYRDQILQGFQREDQKRWINELTEKFNLSTTFVTDPITTCLDSTRVHWEINDSQLQDIHNNVSAPIEIGTLTIPYCENFFDIEKPGELIDGQQRSLAAMNATNREEIPILVTSYLINLTEPNEETVKFLREEFVKNNTHKNLPSDLVHLLSIHVHESVLKKSVQRRISAVKIVERLNVEPDSPFYLIIKSTANPEGYITHRSVLDMVYASQQHGILRNMPDEDAQIKILKIYWNAVKEVFSEAWKERPGISKLTHGTGLYAMGQLMDFIIPYIADKIKDEDPVEIIKREITTIADNCIWMEPRDPLKLEEWREYWKPLQNIRLHKDDLSKKITRMYTPKILKFE